MSSRPDIVIAVMGATGTGKSTFINLASGGRFNVGDGLRSCTSSVAYSHEFNVAGRRIILVDTPGFDDTTMSDTDILKMISLHLQTTYEEGIKLSGVLYFHRISDNKMGGVSRRNFNMFRKLCGEETLRNVLIVTTMWGNVALPQAEARERELASDDLLFKPVIEKGARMVRHDNTAARAQAIVRKVIKNHPLPLRIQEELVDKHMDICETGAAIELDREMAALIKKHNDDLADIQQEMAQALAEKDEETRKELDAVKKDLEANVDRIANDRERLAGEYAEARREAQEKMAALHEKLEREKLEREAHGRRYEEAQKEYEHKHELSQAQQANLLAEIERLKNYKPPRRGFFEALVPLLVFRMIPFAGPLLVLSRS